MVIPIFSRRRKGNDPSSRSLTEGRNTRGDIDRGTTRAASRTKAAGKKSGGASATC